MSWHARLHCPACRPPPLNASSQLNVPSPRCALQAPGALFASSASMVAHVAEGGGGGGRGAGAGSAVQNPQAKSQSPALFPPAT